MSTETMERARRRHGPARNRRRRTFAVRAGVLLLAGVLLWLITVSVAPTPQRVRVSGNRLLTAEAVTAAASVPARVPPARLSEREVGERVAALPAVERVSVRRSWPSTIDVRVTERVPMFGMSRVVGSGQGSGNEQGDGSEQGEVVTLVDAAGATFEGPAPDGLVEGRGPTGDPAVLAAAATVVRALPEDLRHSAEGVMFASKDSITVALSDDRSIFFGSADHVQLKGEVALALVRGTRADHIDVSAPSRPSTR